MGTGPLGLGILPNQPVRNFFADHPDWPSPAQMHRMDMPALMQWRDLMQREIVRQVGDFPAGWGPKLETSDPILRWRYDRLNGIVGIRQWRQATLEHEYKRFAELVTFETKRSKDALQAKYMNPATMRFYQENLQDIKAELARRRRQGGK